MMEIQPIIIKELNSNSEIIVSMDTGVDGTAVLVTRKINDKLIILHQRYWKESNHKNNNG